MIATSEIGERGFTLVEMLVVLVIFGLMTGLVLINAPAADLSLADEAERFGGRLLRAREEALLTNRVVEVRVTAEGYEFGTTQRGQRQPLSTAPFAPSSWAANTTVTIASEGGSRVAFDSTGLSTPAEIDLFRAKGRATIRVDGAGNVQIDAR